MCEKGPINHFFSSFFKHEEHKIIRQYHILPPSHRIDGLKRTPVIGVFAIRHASTLPAIPEPPPIPEVKETVVETVTQALTSSGEPTFASLGLGGWSPVGIIQNCMEFLHIGLDLPWWGSIMIGTICVRTILFPLVILAQRNAAKMHNNMPQMQVIQMKMTEARQTGNQIDAARYGGEMMQFMKEKQLNPIKNMLVPLAQAPLFVSFFMGLREMANTPVTSMMHGGLFWFTDLTTNDPFYALPLITSCTMLATIELGTDSAKLSSQNMQTMRYVLRALPFVVLPFTVNFPAAILCYWTCSNFISLAQVGFLKIPAVRDFFKIDRLEKFEAQALPMKKKKFVEGIKDCKLQTLQQIPDNNQTSFAAWTNMKITNELNERQRMDEIRFQRAGKGPLVKTYKYDPTKARPEAAIQAKKS